MKVVMEEIRTKNIKLYNIQNSNSNMIELNSLIGKGEIAKQILRKAIYLYAAYNWLTLVLKTKTDLKWMNEKTLFHANSVKESTAVCTNRQNKF